MGRGCSIAAPGKGTAEQNKNKTEAQVYIHIVGVVVYSKSTRRTTRFRCEYWLVYLLYTQFTEW